MFRIFIQIIAPGIRVIDLRIVRYLSLQARCCLVVSYIDQFSILRHHQKGVFFSHPGVQVAQIRLVRENLRILRDLFFDLLLNALSQVAEYPDRRAGGEIHLANVIGLPEHPVLIGTES